jgi:hypothetical protein
MYLTQHIFGIKFRENPESSLVTSITNKLVETFNLKYTYYNNKNSNRDGFNHPVAILFLSSNN